MFFSAIAILGSCTENHRKQNPLPNTGNPDRQEMLTYYADEIILPGYAAFKVKLDSLVSKSDAFTSNPTLGSLTFLRQSWEEAYIEWEKVELFDVGPAYDNSLRSFINIYPASASLIESNIKTGAANINFNVPAAYPVQGFPAFDYLLNGIGATDDDILAKYTTDADAAKRIDYLKRITQEMKTRFYQVNSAWTGGYRNTFVNNTGVDRESSLSLLVNGYDLNYERYIRAGKFGIPSGVMNNLVIAPDKVEGYYNKDISLSLAKAANQASVDFFNGVSRKSGLAGSSFSTYLNKLGARDSKTGDSLTTVVNAQFVKVKSKLDLLSDDLVQQVNTNNTAMVDVYNEMQTAVRMLKVDMTSAMSITITYTDNDGD